LKILLVAVNAKYIHSNLAVYSLKAYADRYKEQISIAEYTINHMTEDILKGIYREDADVIAFSCYIWNIQIVTQVMKELKKVQPQAKIWLGGPEVSYDAKSFLSANPEVTGIMIGEGEQTFLELLECYVDQSRELSQIKGLIFREETIENEFTSSDATIISTEQREPLSLDTIPFPYETLEGFEHRIIYYESSRGCPFSCSYCLSSVDRRVRLRNGELVKKELQFFLDRKVPQVKFVDRTFNCNKKHSMDILHYIKEHDNGITNFHFEISADILSEEEIDLLATLRPGQVQLEIGVQSTNPDTITAIRRNMNFEKIKKNVRRIHRANNIHQHLDLIAGLPNEDKATFYQSFNDVYALHPDQLQLGFLKVLKGSPMEQESKEHGIITWNTPPYEVLSTKWISFHDVLQLKGICDMVEIYYNSHQFDYSIQFIEHFFPAPIKLYEALNDYYERESLKQISHSRIRRYEILLEFYRDAVLSNGEDPNLISVMKELLLFDCNLRDEPRSRVSFAENSLKNTIAREFYERLRIEHKNTHLEKFSFDLLRSAEEGKPVRLDNIILFRYSVRDPLSKASTYNIFVEDAEGTWNERADS
jgi:radical SAM superfamily enzyme YgiQ (UPF0313 family)